MYSILFLCLKIFYVPSTSSFGSFHVSEYWILLQIKRTPLINFVYNQAFFLLCSVYYTGEFKSESRIGSSANDPFVVTVLSETGARAAWVSGIDSFNWKTGKVA